MSNNPPRMGERSLVSRNSTPLFFTLLCLQIPLLPAKPSPTRRRRPLMTAVALVCVALLTPAYSQSPPMPGAAKQSGAPASGASIETYRKAAEDGDPPAQFALGSMYMNGHAGVAPDYKQAIMWLRKAAENSDPKFRVLAQIVLGGLFMTGNRDISADWKQADSLLRAAGSNWAALPSTPASAEAASSIGAWYYALSNEAPSQIPDAITQSLAWYQRAADGGSSKAATIAGALRAKIRDTQPAADRDPNDVVAAVLNFTSFGNDDGSNGRFWYKDPTSKCRYLLHKSGAVTNDDAFELLRGQLGQGSTVTGRREIDLDSLDPKNITFRFDGATTITLHVNQPLFIYAGQLDIQRLERGWTLIYTAHCTGKPKAF